MSVACLISSLKLLCYVNKKETFHKTLFHILCSNGKTLFRHFNCVSNQGEKKQEIKRRLAGKGQFSHCSTLSKRQVFQVITAK